MYNNASDINLVVPIIKEINLIMWLLFKENTKGYVYVTHIYSEKCFK